MKGAAGPVKEICFPKENEDLPLIIWAAGPYDVTINRCAAPINKPLYRAAGPVELSY